LRFNPNKSTGERRSPVLQFIRRMVPAFGVVVGLLNSERTQQDRADKDKHGAHRQHVQSQGKVHGLPPL